MRVKQWGHATYHTAFTRCPDCDHATVGLKVPYTINHKENCVGIPDKQVDQPGVWCGNCHLICVLRGDYLCSACREELNAAA